MTLLKVALDPATVVVAVDPGKVSNDGGRGDGKSASEPSWVRAALVSGGPNSAFVADLERRHPGSTRLGQVQD